MANAIIGDSESAENIGDKAGEPVRQVRRWRRIERTGAVPLREAVRQGRVSLVDGEVLAMLPESAQLEALRGGEHAVRAAVEQVRAAKAKAGPPAAGKADPLAAAFDAVGALNGVDLAKLLRRYKPSLAAVWEQSPKAEKDALLARSRLASGPVPASPPAAKLNGGAAARGPSDQEVHELCAKVFNGDVTLVKDYIWFYVCDSDNERDEMLRADPGLADEWMARAIEPNYFPKHYPKIQLARLMDTLNEELRLMPHNKQLRECADDFLKGFHVLERVAARKELDAHLQRAAVRPAYRG